MSSLKYPLVWLDVSGLHVLSNWPHQQAPRADIVDRVVAQSAPRINENSSANIRLYSGKRISISPVLKAVGNKFRMGDKYFPWPGQDGERRWQLEPRELQKRAAEKLFERWREFVHHHGGFFICPRAASGTMNLM